MAKFIDRIGDRRASKFYQNLNVEQTQKYPIKKKTKFKFGVFVVDASALHSPNNGWIKQKEKESHLCATTILKVLILKFSTLTENDTVHSSLSYSVRHMPKRIRGEKKKINNQFIESSNKILKSESQSQQ